MHSAHRSVKYRRVHSHTLYKAKVYLALWIVRIAYAVMFLCSPSTLKMVCSDMCGQHNRSTCDRQQEPGAPVCLGMGGGGGAG